MINPGYTVGQNRQPNDHFITRTMQEHLFRLSFVRAPPPAPFSHPRSVCAAVLQSRIPCHIIASLSPPSHAAFSPFPPYRLFLFLLPFWSSRTPASRAPRPWPERTPVVFLSAEVQRLPFRGSPCTPPRLSAIARVATAVSAGRAWRRRRRGPSGGEVQKLSKTIKYGTNSVVAIWTCDAAAVSIVYGHVLCVVRRLSGQQ